MELLKIDVQDLLAKGKFNSNREDILERAIQCVKWAKNFVDDVEFYAGWHADRGYSFFHANRNHYIQDCPENLYINFFNQSQ